MKSRALIALFFSAALLLGRAGEVPSAIALTRGDVQSVEIALKPGVPPKLNIFFAKKKLLEAQEVLGAHLGQPITITMEGKLVATPRIKSPTFYKNRFVSLVFPDLDSALAAAKLLVPSK